MYILRLYKTYVRQEARLIMKINVCQEFGWKTHATRESSKLMYVLQEAWRILKIYVSRGWMVWQDPNLLSQ